MTLHQLIAAIGLSTTIFIAFAVAELVTGRFKLRGISLNDWILDVVCYGIGKWAVPPLTAFAIAAVTTYLLPRYAGVLHDTPWPVQFLAFVVLEDQAQYWWHRSVHSFPRLWGLHMVHHTAPYMGVRMSSRNSFLYQLLFPNHYTAALLVYLGFGETYVWYNVIKTTVTTAAHSEIRWDAFLYRYRVLRPLAWIIQRTISTPTTHFAHHASAEGDGIGHYSGNFGNLLFFWDVLYGSALISQQYPPAVGIRGEPAREPWYVQIFYPILRSRRGEAASELPSSATATAT